MKLLFVGTFPPPITGQSFAFSHAYNNYPGEKSLVNINNDGKLLGKLISNIRTLSTFTYQLLFNRPDLIYLTCSRSKMGLLKDIYTLHMSHWFGIKVINHVHGSDFKDLLDNTQGWLKKGLISSYSKIDTSIILLKEMEHQFTDFKETMKVVPIANFYDPALDAFPHQEKKSSPIRFCYFSNLIYSKGFSFALEAFERVINQGYKCELHIAGKIIPDGYRSAPEMEAILNEYLEKGLPITYHGVVTKEEKAAFLFQSDIFLLPTFYPSEGVPISILEAMRAGNVILTTDHKYLKYMFYHQAGEIIPPKSVEALEKAMVKYLDDPTLLRETQRENSQVAIKNYSLEAHLKNLYQIFDDAVLQS